MLSLSFILVQRGEFRQPRSFLTTQIYSQNPISQSYERRNRRSKFLKSIDKSSRSWENRLKILFSVVSINICSERRHPSQTDEEFEWFLKWLTRTRSGRSGRNILISRHYSWSAVFLISIIYIRIILIKILCIHELCKWISAPESKLRNEGRKRKRLLIFVQLFFLKTISY